MFMAYRPISVSIFSTGKRKAMPNWPESLGSRPWVAGTYEPEAPCAKGCEPSCGMIGDTVPGNGLPRWPPTTVMLLHEPGSAPISVLVAVKYVPQASTEVLFHCSW